MSYWKVALYHAFIDHMIMELESRLIKSDNRFYAQYLLLPRVIGNITNEQIATLYETYQTDLTCNLDEFKREGGR
jgi:tRNA isopentenyl-2-thiomethyl-A-37 hydroxylase MiaE